MVTVGPAPKLCFAATYATSVLLGGVSVTLPPMLPIVLAASVKGAAAQRCRTKRK